MTHRMHRVSQGPIRVTVTGNDRDGFDVPQNSEVTHVSRYRLRALHEIDLYIMNGTRAYVRDLFRAHFCMAHIEFPANVWVDSHIRYEPNAEDVGTDVPLFVASMMYERMVSHMSRYDASYVNLRWMEDVSLSALVVAGGILQAGGQLDVVRKLRSHCDLTVVSAWNLMRRSICETFYRTSGVIMDDRYLLAPALLLMIRMRNAPPAKGTTNGVDVVNRLLRDLSTAVCRADSSRTDRELSVMIRDLFAGTK